MSRRNLAREIAPRMEQVARYLGLPFRVEQAKWRGVYRYVFGKGRDRKVTFNARTAWEILGDAIGPKREP